MIRTPTDERLFRLRLLPKDLGVALVALLALGMAWLVMQEATGRTSSFLDEESGMRMSYPAGWNSVDSLQDLMLKVEDPFTPSAFKSSMSVEQRLLDANAPPTLQTLLDRRVAERGQLIAYQFVSEEEATVAGERAIRSDFAYVVQPIAEPRRPALPVVVMAREYIVISGERSYYLTLAAPEADWERALDRFERAVASLELP